MNPRFKELRGEAFRLTEWEDLDYDAILEKFGELIVRECEQVSLKSSHRDDDMGAIIAKQIREHFGVEE